jgi:two-component system cell cycle sensor histidine kinase/response regulator CckA
MNTDVISVGCPTYHLLRRQLALVDATAKFYSAAFESASDAMVVVDDGGRVHAANGAACRLYAVDRYELVGLRIQDLFPADVDLLPALRGLREKGEASLEFTETAPDGGRTSTRVEARKFRPHRYVVAFHDVSWQKKLEVALERAHDLETLCHATAGVVHDLNNLLTPIICYADALSEANPGDDEVGRMTREMRAAAERAGSTARRLLSFARPAHESPVPVEMNGMLEELKGFFALIMGEHVEIDLQLDPELAAVNVDRERLERVVLNLVLNARDAMPKGGRLTITTANVIRAEASGLEGSGSRPGNDNRFVTLAVKDTGEGIEARLRERIFEPFFTTKGPQDGSGLGLFTAISFLNRNGGYIELDTEVGRGSTFRIGLPARPGPAPS